MTKRSAFDIGEAIKRLRELRERFIIDQTAAAYINTERLVDRTHPLQVAQLDQTKLYMNLYKPDSKALDQKREQRRRIQSAMLAKLALPVWGYNRDTPTDTETRVAELERDMQLLAKDGLLPHERRLPRKIASPISGETLRHNSSLLPGQRQRLFDVGLSVPAPFEKRTGRKRTKPVVRQQALRQTLFLRSRNEWRPAEVFAACEALHAVRKWVEMQEPGDHTVDQYTGRYRVDDLHLSESKFTPGSFPARLAVAIASSDHAANGTDDYLPNDALASSVSYHYGVFLRAIKAKPGQDQRQRAVEFFNKLLIYKDE